MPAMRDRAAVEMQLGSYRDSLEQWKSGYLTPTEPDPDERQRTMDRLKVGIAILEWVLGGEFR